MKKIIIVAIICVLFLVVFIDMVEPHGYGFFSKVGNGQVAVVTSFGKVQDEVLEPGFHFKNYFEVLHPISVQTQSQKISLMAFSKDIQQVNTSMTINFSVDKANVTNLYKNVGGSYYDVLVLPRAQENLKIVFARYTAEELIQRRDELATSVFELMVEDLENSGIRINSITVDDIDFTDAFTNAVEEKQVASQKKLTATTEQERLTMEAEQEAERQTIAAQAAAEQERIRADAEAYSIRARAEAEAEANAMINASLTEELIDYTKVQIWDGQMPMYMGNGTPILNFDEVVE